MDGSEIVLKRVSCQRQTVECSRGSQAVHCFTYMIKVFKNQWANKQDNYLWVSWKWGVRRGSIWELVVMWLFWTGCSFVPIQSCCKFKQEFFRDSRFLSACFINWLNCKYILSVSNTAEKVKGGAPGSPWEDSCGSFYQEAGRRGSGKLASDRYAGWWMRSCVVVPNSLGFTLLISLSTLWCR